jgi:hypothetical protein
MFLGMLGVDSNNRTATDTSQSAAPTSLQAVSCLMVGCGLMTAFSGQEGEKRKRAEQVLEEQVLE